MKSDVSESKKKEKNATFTYMKVTIKALKGKKQAISKSTEIEKSIDFFFSYLKENYCSGAKGDPTRI